MIFDGGACATGSPCYGQKLPCIHVQRLIRAFSPPKEVLGFETQLACPREDAIVVLVVTAAFHSPHFR